MIVLSRRCDEKIVIDDQIQIKILSISGGRVRVGVSAPAEVVIRRHEQLDGGSLDCGPVLVLEAELVSG